MGYTEATVRSKTEGNMKFVLVNTAYRAMTDTVEEYYFQADDGSVLPIAYAIEFWSSDIPRLSQATTWNSFDDAANYLERYKLKDYKIVPVKDEDLFTARLKGT